MEIRGNATAYVGGQQGRPLPARPEHLHRAHRPWCVDCKTKFDAADLDDQGRCTGCAATAVRRAEAAAQRAEREAAAQAAAAEQKARAAAIKKVATEVTGPAAPAPTIPERRPTPAPRTTPKPPQAGNQGRPTTRSSAPRATSTSSTSGRAPDAGSATTEKKNPPAAPETRPPAAGGLPRPRPAAEQILDAQVDHAARALRRSHQHTDPMVRMLRAGIVSTLEALYVYLEIHHPTVPDTRDVGAPTPDAEVTGQDTPPGFQTYQRPRHNRTYADLTEQQATAAVTAYLAGRSLEQLGKDYNVLPVTIRNLVIGAGHQIRTKNATFADRARRIAATGLSPLELKQWGVANGVINQVVKGHVPGHLIEAYEAATHDTAAPADPATVTTTPGGTTA